MNSTFKDNAEKGKVLYKRGEINRSEAMEYILPYIDEFNEKSKAIAKKWNQKAKTISFATYIR